LAFLFLFLGSSTLALFETFCSFLATLGMLFYLLQEQAALTVDGWLVRERFFLVAVG
jgi:hypothetical protein